ncbi:MAG: deoxyguanosinetriphosphate triphosphohydrolase [Verrucomicrobia bacterium]|jgi:dGTPase|nr:deoxyguanosinetriphosphate triphosphohydrolase [Verrucomicrobiota bacterium]
MPCDRKELERRESKILAPFAQLSCESLGRRHAEDPPEWRTHFQRDRDRVIHSRAFRRLEYKTQVFLNGSGDHLRTRLTHTMEVAGIARNIARALRLNEDLCETIALAHDLGHSPFGHKGEEALNQLMKDHGGFEHNLQSLRVVEELEQKYPSFSGLNLTWETREGLAKHYQFDGGSQLDVTHAFKRPSLEAQVANLADEIAYYSHDLDDGLESGLISEPHLSGHVEIWRLSSDRVQKQYGDLKNESRRYFIIRCIIDDMVKDVVHTTESRILDSSVKHAHEVRNHNNKLVDYSVERKSWNAELREYLYRNLYYNPVVHEPNLKAVRMLVPLFHHFMERPEEMGSQFGRHQGSAAGPRAVCNYLAGMTDLYVLREYERLFPSGSDRLVKSD